MVISISNKLWQSALNGDKSIAIGIRSILSLIETAQHSLHFESVESVDKIIENDEFISFKDVIRSYYTQSYYTSELESEIVRVTDMNSLKETLDTYIEHYTDKLIEYNNGSENMKFISLDAVKTYLSEPLHIVVENSNSDKLFFSMIYHALHNKNLDNRKVKFVHGGGSETPKILSSYNEPHRVICIIDSDKLYPNDPKSEEKIAEYFTICNEFNHKLIVLERREIENYIPDTLLKKWAIDNQKLNTKTSKYFDLPKEVKKFFDLKKGLCKKSLECPNLSAFYNQCLVDINDGENVENALIEGFGRNVYTAFENALDFSEDLVEEAKAEFEFITKIIDMYA